uniref:Uncharacterized protein n=1 Tax=Arundo donax TaxID=35708 RepID=A0A0A9GTB0_ARUDO
MFNGRDYLFCYHLWLLQVCKFN